MSSDKHNKGPNADWEIHRTSVKTEGRRKVAVLFGWANSKHKHISKYAHVLTNLGFDVVQLQRGGARPSFPEDFAFRKVEPFLAWAEKELKLSESGKEEDVVLQVFSNGGVQHYVHMLNLMETKPSYAAWAARVRGVVFDSAPAHNNIFVASNALSAHIPNRFKRFLFWLALLVFFLLSELVYRIFHCKAYVSNENCGFPYLNRSKTHRAGLPLHYIYSKADAITQHQYLHDFIADQSTFPGFRVTSLELDKSAHVDHLRTYPNEYRASIHNFLTSVVKIEGLPALEAAHKGEDKKEAKSATA